MHNDMPRPEEWRRIPSHPDYEVSSYGRVLSYKRRQPRLLKGFVHPLGYVRLNVDGRQHSVHRLVAEAFIGPCPEDKEVDHINRIRHDNRPENLRYLTRQENMARMVPRPFTECVNGHSMTGDNVYVRPSSGRHECRACSVLRVQRAKDKPESERKPFEHATPNGYQRGCRCIDCKTAHTTYRRERARMKRLAQGSDTAANEAC
jgi:hypothetical protein